MNYLEKYNYYIYNLFKNLTSDYSNYDLSKIFEYYVCIQLYHKYNKEFYEYSDILPEYKELHGLSKSDTGIDCSDMIDTIVQCKLRKNIQWSNITNFIANNIELSQENNKLIVPYQNMILAKKSDAIISGKIKKNILQFEDFNKDTLIQYCQNLMNNPPKFIVPDEPFVLRDYQIEAIELIKNSNKNSIINLPTGAGKNAIITETIDITAKNIIFVPQCLLSSQMKEEIIKLKPEYKNHIQIIGDGNNKYKEDKNITICVYNSIEKIPNLDTFKNIFVDEGHNIYKPNIYKIQDDDEETEDLNNTLKSQISGDNINNEGDTYIEKIRKLNIYNNNKIFSATIDKIEGFDYYSKDIRQMIDKGYLCDYTINIPIFTEKANNETICRYLLSNEFHIIIYCKSQEEGKEFCKIMNNLKSNSCKYIDCKTSKTERNKIIDDYKNGFIPFLVNVEILIEGFNAPITRGVCFLHMPSSGTKIIQIIGRMLRKHPTKKIAKVILPFSKSDNEKVINEFIKTISRNDKRMRKSYEEKKIGGYINIENVEEGNNEEYELMYEKIYDGLGKLINVEEIWLKNYENSRKYIDENKKKPSSVDINLYVKKLAHWIFRQNQNYRNYETDNNIMNNIKIRKIWEQFLKDYEIYFVDNIEKWFQNLQKLKKYIDIHNKLPVKCDDEYISTLHSWLHTQKANIQKNIGVIQEDNIKNEWFKFLEEYSEFFPDRIEIWKLKLSMTKSHINENKKRPKSRTFLDRWLVYNKTNYSKKIKIMNIPEIRKLWEEFIDEYNEYVLNDYDKWFYKLSKVKKYIDLHKIRPSSKHQNVEIRILGSWLINNTLNYKRHNDRMKYDAIRKEWEKFVEEYKYYL